MNSAAILHLETINMMTKYQLVFVKLDTAVSKLVRIIKTKELLNLQRAFEQYRGNVSIIKNAENYKARMILKQMSTSIQHIKDIYERKAKFTMSKFVGRWRENVAKGRVLRDLTKKLATNEEKHKKEIATKEHKISSLEQKIQQQTAEATTLKENEKVLRQTIKEREDKEKTLKETLEKAKKREGEDKKMPKNVEERLQVLEAHVASLENENKDLKERIDSTETNVGSFIQEVGEILDSHPFNSMELLDIII